MRRPEVRPGLRYDTWLLDTFTGSSLKQAFDFAKVRHKSGGESILYFRSYDQGSDRVQAMTLDFAWADEEPEEAYYYELLARTSAVQGPVHDHDAAQRYDEGRAEDHEWRVGGANTDSDGAGGCAALHARAASRPHRQLPGIHSGMT
jgi:hypothetical protein